MRIIWVVAIGVGLAGCIFPPAASLAGFATDGVATDGAGKDCAVWYTINGQDICRDGVDEAQSATAAGVPALGPEHPQEVVGDERPEVVLDGRS